MWPQLILKGKNIENIIQSQNMTLLSTFFGSKREKKQTKKTAVWLLFTSCEFCHRPSVKAVTTNKQQTI